MTDIAVILSPWPLWRRILFRYFFIFFLLIAAPWTWASEVPGISWLVEKYNGLVDWLVDEVNRTFLHIRPVLVPLNGSGDTSFGWAALWTFCLVALIGTVLWSALDKKRHNYIQLNYWLCILLRYYLALNALGYGIAKLFLTQMPFPNTSELATPLGDFLPMRLSWMFIGYSAPYQFFSGLMECMVGLLLIYRRTATLGAMLAAGIFVNVAMLNLCYDIPVKIFSLEMVAISLFLLANEWKRISCFFFLNRQTEVYSIYHYRLSRRWMRIGRIVLKVCFIILAVGVATWQTKELRNYYSQVQHEVLTPGLYDVTSYSINNVELPPEDTVRWKDVVFDGKRSGSIRTGDTNFTEQYGRKYFVYDVDTARGMMEFQKITDGSSVATLKYTRLNEAGIQLSGLYNGDSLRLSIKSSKHHYQLTDRQFHWVSEANR